MAEYVCRLLAHMERHGYKAAAPVDDDPSVKPVPLLDFEAGYVQRSIHLFPKGGSRPPWRLGMNYAQDVITLRHRPLEDGAMRFQRSSIERSNGLTSTIGVPSSASS